MQSNTTIILMGLSNPAESHIRQPWLPSSNASSAVRQADARRISETRIVRGIAEAWWCIPTAADTLIASAATPHVCVYWVLVKAFGGDGLYGMHEEAVMRI